jgi:pyrroline-5-carboxylate reductase
VKLGLIGAGNMASALARGIGEPVIVHDVDEAKARALADELGGEAVGSNAELAERADGIVLCHKPAQLEQVAAEVAPAGADVVVSILAATGTEKIAVAYPGASIYRFIPNIPAEVRRAVLCYVPGPGAADGPEDEILELMRRTGTVIRLEDEPLIEPAMALMACGPGFLALVAETFAEAGTAHGLEPEDAMRMVVETMGGTADYLAQHGYDGPALRARVAPPGGTTERGLI